jgi:ribulose 1,5-bisphosphate synthetase/thiazole synthase
MPSGWTRREFLRNAAGAPVALAARPGWGLAQETDVRFARAALPVIAKAEVAIAGGSFAAVAAARALAQAGKRVVLVESRTYLGREATATIRPWTRGPGTRPAAIKLDIEDRLLGSGVDLLYGSHPVQVLPGRGMVIGNKSGRQVILAGVLVDATPAACLARIAGAGFEAPRPEHFHFRRTLEFARTGEVEDGLIAMPRHLGIEDNGVLARRGPKGVVYVECPLHLPVGGMDYPGMMLREIEARRRTFEVAAHLIATHPGFRGAFFTRSAYELDGAFATPSTGTDIRRLDETDPQKAEAAGEAFAKALLADGLPAPALGKPADPGPGLVREPESPQRGRFYETVDVPRVPIPVLDRVDVLVVGGGTSGATATIVAAGQGRKTALADMSPGLGGTGTLGGVNDYWGKGKYAGFTKRHVEAMERFHARVPDFKNWKGYVTWNVEAKMQMLLDAAVRAGAGVYWNAEAIGAVMDDDRVAGVVVATSYGPAALLAKVTIDATGDADVAAFAGAPTVFGSERDHLPMWYSMPQFRSPGNITTTFESTADVSNVRDYTRAILMGRRRGGTYHDHTVYLAPRESRRIVGDVVVTLTDTLRFREWPDAVNVHCSNCDVKGKSVSDWFSIGLQPPVVEIEVPYRALIPRGVEGLIVAGKAISCTHDAIASIRMQQDMENLGGVAALAAAQSLEKGVRPRDIDVKMLQEKLAGLGLLPPEVLKRAARPATPPLKEVISRLDAGKPLSDHSRMEMWEVSRERVPFVEVCAADPVAAVPLLEAKLREAMGKEAMRLAQAVAFLGSPAWADVLAGELLGPLGGRGPPSEEGQGHARGGGGPRPGDHAGGGTPALRAGHDEEPPLPGGVAQGGRTPARKGGGLPQQRQGGVLLRGCGLPRSGTPRAAGSGARPEVHPRAAVLAGPDAARRNRQGFPPRAAGHAGAGSGTSHGPLREPRGPGDPGRVPGRRAGGPRRVRPRHAQPDHAAGLWEGPGALVSVDRNPPRIDPSLPCLRPFLVVRISYGHTDPRAVDPPRGGRGRHPL